MDPELLGEGTIVNYTFADLLADAEALANKAGGPAYVEGRSAKAKDSFAYSETGEDSVLELEFEADRYGKDPDTTDTYVVYHVDQDFIEHVETVPEPVLRKAVEVEAYEEGEEEAHCHRILNICCRFSTDPMFDFKLDLTTYYHVNDVPFIMHEGGVDVIEDEDHDGDDDEQENGDEREPDEFDKLAAQELKDMFASSDYLKVRDMLTTLMTREVGAMGVYAPLSQSQE